MAEMPETIPPSYGRKPKKSGVGAPTVAARRDTTCRVSESLIEQMVGRENMRSAFQKVVENKGAPGVDGIKVNDLRAHLNSNWERIKVELLEGKYFPQPVRAVAIPKPSGGTRRLGIPTVVDRVIAQAVHQILEPLFDQGFSENSYGFRRGRSARDAVLKAHSYVVEGYRWTVDLDLEKFFDRVNHDILMARIARKVKDKRILLLIRRFLQSGILIDGVVSHQIEGTPQGSPLSPLLSNILLDDLDKELERRGHRYCRYADDVVVYVKSKRSGERVMKSLEAFLVRRLRLKLNAEKSNVCRPWKTKFLGYTVTAGRKPRIRISPDSVKRLKDALKPVFRMGRGSSQKHIIKTLNPKLLWWINYFNLADIKVTLEDLDVWIRRRLRLLIWRKWKRIYTKERKLIGRGVEIEIAHKTAFNGRGPWWGAGSMAMCKAYNNTYFEMCGLVSLFDQVFKDRNTTQTAVYGTVRTVV
jgi:RNA-directed DNA polymerase